MIHMILMELRRGLLQMRRYPVESVLSFLILAGMFFGISYGASAAFGTSVPPHHVASVTLVSYLGWMLCMNLLSGPAAELEAEAQSGTIEQLFTGGIPLTRILVARMIANVIVTMGIVAVIGAIAGLLTSARIGPLALSMIALACVTAAGGGLALAGAALLFKRTRALVLLVTFGLMPVMMANIPAQWATDSIGAALLPFAGPIGMAKAMIVHGSTPGPATVVLLVAATLAYLAAGAAIFRAMRNHAMRLGTIGHY